MPSFNLVTEKWIPCIKNGKTEELGLQEVLVSAHKIQEIFDPSPVVTISLHRLLLAILHRNFGPENLEKWKTLWQKEQWDGKTLSDYLAKWHYRFDLFDEKRPFYQSLELARAKKHPVLHLAMEASSGNNATLFDHNDDSRPNAVSPAVAARYIIAAQAFSIGFGNSSPFYFSDSPLIRGMTALIQGNTLFETLSLNLLIYNEDRPFPHVEQDIPVWEQDNLKKPDRNGSRIFGYLDYLTWQSRNIHLFPEGNPTCVRYCQVQQNLKLPKQTYFDPFKCYWKSERGYVPMNISPDKAVWRDSHALLQTVDSNYKRPEIFNLIARLEDERHNGRIKAQPAYRMAVLGLATAVGKAGDVLLWRHERLPLPLKYLADEALLGGLKEALDVTESSGKVLDKATWYLAKLLIAPDADKPNKQQKNEISNLLNHLATTRPFWSRMGMSFNRLLLELAKDRKDEDGQTIYGATVLPWWAEEVRSAARAAFEETTRSLDRSARMLKAVTQAESLFNYRLGETIKSYKNKIEGGEK